MMNEYIWAAGCRISKKTADANVIGEKLHVLQAQNSGRLTARIVVDAARPEASPLHPCFEWDDLRAAELWREEQARHVISSIRILQRDDESETPRVMHAYVNLEETIDDELQRGYVPMARVLGDRDLLAQAVAKAGKELKAFEDRYAQFDAIARAVRIAREEIQGLALV
jgi:hypothetical protein